MASKRSALDQNASSAKKKPKRLCSFSSSWISEEFEVEHDGQTKSYSGRLLSGKDGDERAFCKQCKVSFSVSHGGAYDVRRHFKSAGHNNALDSAKKTARLEAFGFGDSRKAKAAREKQEEQKMQVLSAEAQFVQFVAEHNLPFRCGDHLTKLVKSMFPDSDIARQFQCSRTKTMVLVRNGNSKFCQDELLFTLTGDDIVSCCCIYVYYIIKQEFLLAIASQNHSMIIIGLYYMLVAFHDLAVQQLVITF